jgi:hypothetical protein
VQAGWCDCLWKDVMAACRAICVLHVRRRETEVACDINVVVGREVTTSRTFAAASQRLLKGDSALGANARIDKSFVRSPITGAQQTFRSYKLSHLATNI